MELQTTATIHRYAPPLPKKRLLQTSNLNRERAGRRPETDTLPAMLQRCQPRRDHLRDHLENGERAGELRAAVLGVAA